MPLAATSAPLQLSKKETKRQQRQARLEAAIKFSVDAVEAEPTPEDDAEVWRMRQFIRFLNSFIQKEHRERTGNVNRFHESDVADIGGSGAAAAGARAAGGQRRRTEQEPNEEEARRAMRAEVDADVAAADTVPVLPPVEDAHSLAPPRRDEPFLELEPAGYTLVETAPAADLDLKGEYVLFKWDGAPVPREKFGWYHGKVAGAASEATRRRNPLLTHMVTYANSETGNVLPASYGVNGLRAKATVALGLGTDVWGTSKKWVLLRDVGLNSE